MLINLSDILRQARMEKWAVPHFNISDITMLRGLFEAARESRSPLLVGASEGESAFWGMRQAVALVASLRAEYNWPIFLNADHCRNVESARAAIDAGYDSVHIDLSAMPLEENIAGTRKVVDYARAKNPMISVEGEVGYLVTESSQVYKKVVEVPLESLAKVEDAVRFVGETSIDRLAPAVGTLHGIAANAPKIDFERIAAIYAAVGEVILVLHGGSGSSDEQIRQAISAGIANVHFSTEIRMAYAAALRQFLADHPEETTPYKILIPALEAVKEKALEKIELFGASKRV